jgi:hypothetical protein
VNLVTYIIRYDSGSQTVSGILLSLKIVPIRPFGLGLVRSFSFSSVGTGSLLGHRMYGLPAQIMVE